MHKMGGLGRRLCGGLWHTTHPERFLSIMECGAILPEPDIPNSERWKTSRGPDYYPFVRVIGGLSLFDFKDFNSVSYEEAHPLSSWRKFVPYRPSWGGSVWIEIDREAIADKFVAAGEIVSRRNEGRHYRHMIMPRIEAAYLGPLFQVAFRSAFLAFGQDGVMHEISLTPFDLSAYETILRHWRLTIKSDEFEEIEQPYLWLLMQASASRSNRDIR